MHGCVCLVGSVTPQTALHWQSGGGAPSEHVQLPKSLVGLRHSVQGYLTAGIGVTLLLSLQLLLSSFSCKLELINCCWICSCVKWSGVVSLPRPASLFFPFLPAISSSPEVSFSASVVLRLQLCCLPLQFLLFILQNFYMDHCAGKCSWFCQKVVDPQSERMDRRHSPSENYIFVYLFILGN